MAKMKSFYKNSELDQIEELANAVVKKAGRMTLQYFKKDPNYIMKGRQDVLAEADLLSEKMIVSQIKKVFPDHGILSEECGEKKGRADYFWIIDPIDGTINFLKGMDEFCISIGVECRGKLVLGIIYAPAQKLLYFARKGKGAFLNGKKIAVSKETKMINAVLASDNSAVLDKRLENFEFLRKLSADVRTVRVLGSSALHLARVASGTLDVYFKAHFNYWDFAAGILLVEEAGGKITDFFGRRVTKNSENIIVSNGLLHKGLHSLVAAIAKERNKV